MRFGGPARLVDRFATAPLEGLQVVVPSVLYGERAGPRIVAFLPTQVGAPPCPRRLLGLPIVKNGNAIRVLQIVRGANPVLCIPAGGQPPPREPRAAADPSAIP